MSLTVVGSSHGGYYLKRVKRLIKDYEMERHILFTGFVPYRLVPLFVNAADVALAPYRKIVKNDVTPLKVLEYLACQKIVPSKRIPEISKRFGNLVNFYEGVAGLTEFLKAISANRSDFGKKAINARENLAEYSWDVLARRYCQILESAAASRG